MVTREDGTPVLVGWYSDEFGRLVAKAGVATGTLHAARHTAASLMAQLGIPMVVAAAWLGQIAAIDHAALPDGDLGRDARRFKAA